MFLQMKEIDLVGYADDNTPYTQGSSCESVTNTLVQSVNDFMIWFNNNYMKLNSDKCHLILSGKYDFSCVAKIDNDDIIPSQN